MGLDVSRGGKDENPHRNPSPITKLVVSIILDASNHGTACAFRFLFVSFSFLHVVYSDLLSKLMEPQLKVQATRSYAPTSGCNDQLSFPKGAIITVIEKTTAEWWWGLFRGHEGWFPPNYCQPYASRLPNSSASSVPPCSRPAATTRLGADAMAKKLSRSARSSPVAVKPDTGIVQEAKAMSRSHIGGGKTVHAPSFRHSIPAGSSGVIIIVGNYEYGGNRDLVQVRDDCQRIEEMFRRMGYFVVDPIFNVGAEELREFLVQVRNELAVAEVEQIVVFFSGHGSKDAFVGTDLCESPRNQITSLFSNMNMPLNYRDKVR